MTTAFFHSKDAPVPTNQINIFFIKYNLITTSPQKNEFNDDGNSLVLNLNMYLNYTCMYTRTYSYYFESVRRALRVHAYLKYKMRTSNDNNSIYILKVKN